MLRKFRTLAAASLFLGAPPRPRLLCGLAILLAIGIAHGAQAEVAVRYAPARTVSSWAFRSVQERDGMFRELAHYLERIGGRLLPSGRSATIELLEVQPAGRFEPWRASPGDDIRILRDTTPPRVRLRYSVTERGRTTAQGEETVTDMNYLSNLSARASSDGLAYEKEMLRDWLLRRLVRLEPQRR